MQPCLFCSGDASAPDHDARCCGRQGHVDAEPTLPPYNPFEHARTTDPETSFEAAYRVDAKTGQARVLAIMNDAPDGIPDEALTDIYDRKFPGRGSLESRLSSARKRRSDLTRAGIVVDSGKRVQLRSGRRGVVWILARYAHTG